MNGNDEIETETLKRIIALLFALADLADRVSSRSYPVRCFVLWLLHRAEVVARDWVAPNGEDDRHPSSHEHPATVAAVHRNSPTDAIHLAQAFRALAYELKRQLRLEEQFARRLLRGKASHAETTEPRSGLFAPDQMSRLAQAILAALSNMGNVAHATPPRFDTS
ncbi:MAG: hypothetical protein AB7P20_17415 [Rhizobiaceae bacterium]